MIGITSYGAHIPRYRMNHKVIFEQMGWFFNPVTANVAKGEKAVANFDEDTTTMASYTGDNLAFSLDPPAIYGLVDFKDCGRRYLDLTDCTLQDMKVGMPDAMTFRKKYTDLRRGKAYINEAGWGVVPRENVQCLRV